jgi:probable phosphomutase (TIGR03848 family)
MARKTAPRKQAAGTKTSGAERAAEQGAAPRPTTVLLVRHGQTSTTGKLLPGRAKGLHLADEGIRQAERAAERLSELERVDAIYCSPLERTKETAAPIGKALGIRPKVDRGLLECDFGDWTGAELKKLMKLPEWRTVQKAPSSFRFPNGESFTEMQVRIVSALDRLRSAHPGGVIVCVSHADPIKAAMAHALGTHLDLFQRIVISTCSISAVAWSTDGPIALTVNSTGGSLRELAPS